MASVPEPVSGERVSHSPSEPVEHLRTVLSRAAIPSWRRLLIYSFLFALFVFVSGLMLDYTLLIHKDSPLATVEISDALAGLLAGVLFLRVLLANRTRRERILHRVQMINEMNDRIRNALQVIQFTVHSNPAQAKQVSEIDHAVKRIQTALDELPRV